MLNSLISGKTILLILCLLGCSSLTAQEPDYNPHKLERIITILEKVKSDTDTWNLLKNRYFSGGCNSSVLFINYKTGDTLNITIKELFYNDEPVQVRNIYIKTNTIGLAGAIVNAAAEIDIRPHLSFSLPVYYSAWNYFKTTIKLRTLHIQPELRYWLNETNDGLYVGAHFGLGSYNVAMDGKYRYQDHNRRTPAIGGGLALGYRMPISNCGKWYLEFSLGCGAYKLHYDIFQNTPITKRGLKTGEVKKTYIGADQAAVSISYLLPGCRNSARKEGER